MGTCEKSSTKSVLSVTTVMVTVEKPKPVIPAEEKVKCVSKYGQFLVSSSRLVSVRHVTGDESRSQKSVVRVMENDTPISL